LGQWLLLCLLHAIATPALAAPHVSFHAASSTLDIGSNGTKKVVAGKFYNATMDAAANGYAITATSESNAVLTIIQPELGQNGIFDLPFNAGGIFAVGAPTDLDVADINADGISDIALGLNTGFAVYISTPQGYTFTFYPVNVPQYDTSRIAFGDVVISAANNAIDIVYAYGRITPTQASIHQGTQNANAGIDFGSPLPVTMEDGSSAGGFSAIATGDFDGDGTIEIANGSNVLFFKNTAPDSVIFSKFYAGKRAELFGALAIKSVDWDGDGQLDIVNASAGGFYLTTFSNGAKKSFTLNSAGTNVIAMAVTDVNRDARQDIMAVAATATGQNKLLVYLQRCDFSYDTTPIILDLQIDNSQTSATVNGIDIIHTSNGEPLIGISHLSVKNLGDNDELSVFARNADAVSAIEICAPRIDVLENIVGGRLTVEVGRYNLIDTTESIIYSTHDDAPLSAIAGVDYTPIPLSPPTSLTFAPGEKHKTFTVGILDDFTVEPDKTFLLQLTTANGAVVSSSTVTLLDDESLSIPIPTPINDRYNLKGDAPATQLALTQNDKNVDNLATLQIVVAPSHGTLTAINSPPGTVTYQPDPDYSLSDTFSYTITDTANHTSNRAAVTITLIPQNDPPVAADDRFTVNPAGAWVALNVLANDSDVDSITQGDTFTIHSVSPEDGHISIAPDRLTLSYTPAGFNGDATYQYDIVDFAGSVSEPATISITVAAATHSPPSMITIDNAAIAERNPAQALVGHLSATDPDAGDRLTFGISDDPSGLFAIVNQNQLVVTTALALNYELQNQYSVTVMVTDSQGASTGKIFNIHVTDVNEAPTDIVITGNRVADDAAVGTLVGSLAAIDPDAGDSHAFTFEPGSNSAGFIIDGADLKVADATLFGDMNSRALSITAADTGQLAFTQSLSITFTRAAVTPQANDDTYHVDHGGILMTDASEGLLKNDSNPLANTLFVITTAVNAPKYGDLTLHEDGSFSYQHHGNSVDADSFVYTVDNRSGGATGTDTATVHLTINPADKSPAPAGDEITESKGHTSHGGVIGINELCLLIGLIGFRRRYNSRYIKQ